MLTTIGAGSSGGSRQAFDFAGSYLVSHLYQQCLSRIDAINAGANDGNLVKFSSTFATSSKTQIREVLKRAMTVYWRSPHYNVTRNLVRLDFTEPLTSYGETRTLQRVGLRKASLSVREIYSLNTLRCILTIGISVRCGSLWKCVCTDSYPIHRGGFELHH